MLLRSPHRGWLSLAMIIALTGSVAAQHASSDHDQGKQDISENPDKQQKDEEQEQKRKQDSRQRKPTGGDQDAKDRPRSQDTQAFRVRPHGWVRIATDLDNDGAYDAVETIYYFDLQQARDRSSRRKMDPSETSADDRRHDRQSDQQRKTHQGRDPQQRGGQGQESADAQVRKTRLQGTLQEMRTVQMQDSGKKRVMARIKTSDGRTARVCLGAEKKVDKLDLQQGDRVHVEGVLTRSQDKRALLAARVEANGKTVTHRLTRRPAVQRLQGKLVSLRTATARQGDTRYLVGKVRTEDGTQQVHFGPQQQLNKLELSEGDKVTVLTRTGKVNGKSAHVALQVSAKGQRVKIVPEST